MDPYFIYEVQPTNPNLVEITSPIQKFRGNRQFFDTKHKAPRCMPEVNPHN